MKKRNILLIVGLGFAQLAFLNAHVFAQTQEQTNQLEQVVITASRSPKKLANVGKIVQVITNEDLIKAQGRTLPELLNKVAGLTIAGSGSNPGNIQSLYMRGASASNTLILIDGIAVNDPSGISGEYNLAAIDISMIERVEILKGASSTLYGSDAVAGVINIITKKGSQDLAANAVLSAGSYQTYKGVFGVSGAVNKTKISATFSRLQSNNISAAEPRPNTNANFDNDGFNQTGFGLNLSQYVTNKISVSAMVQANQNQADLDGGAFADDKDYTYNKTALLANLNTKMILNKGEINLNFSKNYVENVFDNQPNTTNNKGDVTNFEGIFNYQFSDFFDLTSGVNYKDFNTNQTNFISSNNLLSIYNSLFFSPTKTVNVEIGGRYNKHNQYGDNFTYNFNPSVLLAKSLKYYINVSSAFRIPSLYQLNSEYGNVNLKPETSRNYETGFQGNFFNHKFNITGSYFIREIENVIDFGVISPNKFGYVNQNFQNDEGVELEVSYKPLDKLTINAFYAYVDGKVKVNETSPEVFNLFRRPKNSFGANLGYQFSKQFLASVNYRFNDQRIDQYYNTSTFSVERVDLTSFSKVDVYLQYQIKKIRLFADVQNVLDANFNEFAGYTAKGINFNTGLSFNLR
jgi:vitamin B12 transporter